MKGINHSVDGNYIEKDVDPSSRSSRGQRSAIVRISTLRHIEMYFLRVMDSVCFLSV